MRVLLAVLGLMGGALAFPSGMPFCTLRPQVQTTWAEQIGETEITFNSSCYNPGDELIVKLASKGEAFHGFVMRADHGQFVRRHGFGGYRWLGEESRPDQSCITHVFPGLNQENGKFLKSSVDAKLLIPDFGRRTPTRIIVESVAIKSFDDKPWEVEWQSGVYSITRASINICRRAPRRRLIPALKISQTQSQSRRGPRPAPARKEHKIVFNPHARCKQASDPGRCDNAPNGIVDWQQPYFYDEGAGVCRKFFWSGCGGNKNRFESLKECERWCTGGNEPCAKKQNDACPPGLSYTFKSAYYLNEQTSQCVHYWYKSCAEDDLPQFGEEEDCDLQCLGKEPKPVPKEASFGPKGKCFELFNKDKKMCPVWATKKICSPYPEDHKGHWAHFNCRLSCCEKWGL